MTTSQQSTLLGYTVEKVQSNPSRSLQLAYLLHGPRGARYGLIRNQKNPEMLFAWNDRRFGTVQVQGYSWFTDRTGTLEPV